MTGNENDQELTNLCSQLDSEGLAAFIEIGDGIIAVQNMPGDSDTLLLEYLRSKPETNVTSRAIAAVLVGIA